MSCCGAAFCPLSKRVDSAISGDLCVGKAEKIKTCGPEETRPSLFLGFFEIGWLVVSGAPPPGSRSRSRTEGGNGPPECVVDVAQQVTVDWMSVSLVLLKSCGLGR